MAILQLIVYLPNISSMLESIDDGANQFVWKYLARKKKIALFTDRGKGGKFQFAKDSQQIRSI